MRPCRTRYCSSYLLPTVCSGEKTQSTGLQTEKKKKNKRKSKCDRCLEAEYWQRKDLDHGQSHLCCCFMCSVLTDIEPCVLFLNWYGFITENPHCQLPFPNEKNFRSLNSSLTISEQNQLPYNGCTPRRLCSKHIDMCGYNIGSNKINKTHCVLNACLLC